MNSMNLETQPNRWSCLATSFAMALGITVEEFIELVGHDGSEILFPDLKEPWCRRGFHVQEAIYQARNLKWTVTPWELFPQVAATGSNETRVIFPWGGEAVVWRLFHEYTHVFRGVIEVRTGSGGHHAVAFAGGYAFDPSGCVFQAIDSEFLIRHYYPYKLWLMEKTWHK